MIHTHAEKQIFIITAHSFHSRLHLSPTCRLITTSRSRLREEKSHPDSKDLPQVMFVPKPGQPGHQGLCTGPRCAPSPCAPSPTAGLSAQQLPVAISPGIQRGCWEIREHAIWKGEMLQLCYFLHRNRFHSSKVKPWFLGDTKTGQWCSVKVNGEWTPTQAEGTFLVKSDSQEMCKCAAEKLTSGIFLDGTFCKN